MNYSIVYSVKSMSASSMGGTIRKEPHGADAPDPNSLRQWHHHGRRRLAAAAQGVRQHVGAVGPGDRGLPVRGRPGIHAQLPVPMRRAHPDDPSDQQRGRGGAVVTGYELSRRRFLTGMGTLAVAFSLAPSVLERQASRAGAATPHGLQVTETTDADSLSWLVLTPAGVTIHSGKVELGTGTQTALTQIVVEELHVDGAHVQYVQGDTQVTPNQGTTAGSKSVQNGGPQLRLAAATAFQALLGLAAQQLGVSKDQLVASDGVFRDTASGRSVTYQQLLAATDLVLAADPNAQVASPDDYQVVG